ncbi:MAG: GIY-YIG nuclease family protein [Patescibacteria group bacterium]
MATLYILFSQKRNMYYIGSTNDLNRRIAEHNRGQTTWTRTGCPWVCVYTEFYLDSKAARRRELQLKSWKNQTRIRELMECSSAG